MKNKTFTALLIFLAIFFVFTFSGNLSAADTCKVTIRTGIVASSGNETVKVEIYDASETKVPSVYTAGSNTTQIQVAPGTYTYKGYSATSASFLGSGKFTVTKDGQVITLKCVIFPKISSPANKNHVWNDDKSYEYASGTAGNNFLLPAIGGDGHYLYAYVPSDPETYWGSNGELYVYATGAADTFQSLNLSDGGSFVVAKKVTITAKVPHGASFDIYNMVKFYRPLEVMEKSEPQREGDYDVYTVEIPDKISTLHYEVRMAGKVTKARMVNSQDYASAPLVINANDLADNPKQIRRDDSQDFRDASLLMNVNDASYLAMNAGDTFDLRCYRNWQAVNSITGNYYVEPDYHYTVAEGNSVTVDEKGRITAVKSGVSVIHVTYDALDWLSDVNKPMIYSAIYPENTGTIVVNVNPDRSTTIKTNINRSSEYDTIYYTKSINGTAQEKQYAEYTFKPTVDKEISVRVQNPLETDWSKGWESYTANSDGSYTVKLHDGRNIIEVKSGNSVEYWVLRGYGLDLSITNSQTGAAIGDTVSLDTSVAITFNGIVSPLAKLGAVYNPGFPDGIYVVYDHDGQTLEGTHTQYNLKTTNTLYIDCDESGTYNLTGGTIHGNVIGGGGGMHRGLTFGGNTGSDSSYNSDGMAGISFDGYLSSLPDISIEVVGKKDETAIAALDFCKVTYQKGVNPTISLGNDTIAADRTSTLDDTLMQVMTANSNSTTASKRVLNYKVKSDNPTQTKMFLRYWTENFPTPTLIPVTQNLTATTSKFSKYDDVTYAELILVPDASAKAYNKTYTLRVSNPTETETKTANPLYGNKAYLVGLSIIPLDGLSQYSTLHGLLKADPITYTDTYGATQTLDLGYGFLGTELNYAATVPGTTSQIQIVPTALVEGSAAPEVTVNGVTVTSGEASQTIDLSEGNNLITIKNITGSDTRIYTVNVYREDALRTVSFTGQSGVTVLAYNSEGAKYSQNTEGTMSLAPGDYTYHASCPGYLVKSGSFTVTKTDSNTVAVGALTGVPAQGGRVSVIVTDDDAVLRNTGVTVSTPADLAKQKYVEYNNGGYTALHAIIDALDSGSVSLDFTCKKGVLTPDSKISAAAQGSNAGWVCEVNGVTVKAASTLVYSGDQVAYYYNPDYSGMLHASFDNSTKTVTAGKTATITLTATKVKNDGAAAAAVANAELYVNGKDSGVKTDNSGKATLDAFPAAGKYIVTAVKKNAGGDNILTYTLCTVTATKPSVGGDSITVSFRLIGDTAHDRGVEGHDGYVNWIATHSYTFDSDYVTVYDVFTRALDGAGLSYVGASDNYVKTITAPVTEGGYALSEFSNGINSGWMYTINGTHPDFGLKQQAVADGDVIVWHYVDDYILESEDGALYPFRWLEADDREPAYITANIAIDELPAAADVTLGDENAIIAARAAYDSLNDTEKSYLSPGHPAKLIADEAKLAEVKSGQAVQTVIDKIALLPAVDKLTLADKNLVIPARTAYNNLMETQKLLVTNYSTLVAAEAKIAALEAKPLVDVGKMTDVKNGDWFYDAVSYILAKGIMNGTSPTTFYPNGDVTRGQFVTVLGRYAGMKDSSASHPAATDFKDVNTAAYYAAHVAWAAENGITTGTSTTTFDPEANITRQDMAVMIGRFAKVMKISLPDGSGAGAFADDGDIFDYAKTAVYSMAEAKIINGMGGNKFSPKTTATRAQAATMISKLMQYEK